MVELDKAVRDSYWYNKQGTVFVDPASVESVEQVFERSAGGSDSPAYTLVVMKSAVTHRVMGNVDKVARQLGLVDA